MHLRRHIDTGMSIQCPFENCNNTYALSSSFSSHLTRKHFYMTTHETYQSDCVVKEVITGLQSFHREIAVDDDVNDSESQDVSSNDDGKSEIDTFQSTLFQSLMRLQELEHLPVSTLNTILDDMTCTVSQTLENSKAAVLSVLKENGVNEEIQTQVAEKMTGNIFQSVVSVMDTPYKRKKYLINKFDYVKPITISFGLNSKHKERQYQYVPILEVLKCMLKSEETLSVVMRGSYKSANESLKDFSDGLLFGQNEFLQTNPAALQVVLYFDEFEVINPLESKRGKQKLAAVYMTLANIHLFERSDLKSIQLCLLCPVVDLKEFGMNKMLEPVVFDLKILEMDGIFMEAIQCYIKGTNVYICADNLGSHQIGGFFESFGGNVSHICRFCMASPEEIQDHYDPSYYTERNEENYTHQIKEVEKDASFMSVYGVKKDSILNSLKHFHVTRGLPPDCLHDLLEGCAKKEISVVLKKLVSDGVLTEKQICSQICIFNYGKCDVTNKPAVPKKLDSITSQSASQMYTLLRLLPLMIGHFIPEDNMAWEIFLLLKDIIEIVTSPTLDKKICPFLQSLISDHHLLLKNTFPSVRMTPKHHYLIHYPEMILKYGPLRSCWCMRFEAKHSYFKQISLRPGNYKNLPLTLAERHQNLQAYIGSSEKTKPMVEINSFMADSNLDTYSYELEQKGFNIHQCTSVKCISIKGITCYLGCFLVSGFYANEPIMSQILKVVVQKDMVGFICKDYTSRHSKHLRAQELTRTTTTRCFFHF